MKRTPLTRYTEMPRGAGPYRKSEIERGAGPRRGTRIAKVGARAKREAPALATFQFDVLMRAGGHCERCGHARPLHAHHIRARAQGGTHDASNGAALCAGEYGCHARVHRYEVEDWPRWIAQRGSK